MNIIVYLVKVIACSSILFLYYRFFLQNRRFHQYNRIFLLLTVCFSVVLPLISIPLISTTTINPARLINQSIRVITIDSWEPENFDASARTGSLSSAAILWLLYFAGLFLALLAIVRSTLYVFRLTKHYSFHYENGVRVFDTDEPSAPFSFFRMIFWNRAIDRNSEKGKRIFAHEWFHVQQRHSFDILLIEIVSAVFWFNPVFYLIKKECRAIHEFLADSFAMNEYDRHAYAELLVTQALASKRIALNNHFFQTHIKRRIAMITKSNKSRRGYLSQLFVLPLFALIFCAFAFKGRKDSGRIPKSSVETAANVPIRLLIDPGHGGQDDGAHSADGKILEKDLTLQISEKIQGLAKDYNVTVDLTRTSDAVTGLKERILLASEKKSDMFLSIHVNAEDASSKYNAPTKNEGIEVLISAKDNKMSNESKAFAATLVQSVSGIYTTNQNLLQRKNQGIWVLDESPCAAAMIECGNITNAKDMAFFSSNENQEKLARKILEAVVAHAKSAR
jgi:N-acetylmuramoyl-L-alanine amidase